MAILKRGWVVMAAAAVAVSAASALAYVQVQSRSQVILDARAPLPPGVVVVATTPEAVARGERLVAVAACAGCHGSDLTGGPLNVFATAVHTPNLTLVSKRRTTAELDAALRHGLRPDGTPELAMPAEAYGRFTDTEMGEIIGYLRSLPPKGVEAPRTEPGLLLRAALLIGKLQTSAQKVAEAKPPIDAGPNLALGRHLTAIACGRCHGSDLGGVKAGAQDITIRGYYNRAKFHDLISKGEAIGEGNMKVMTDTAEMAFSHFTPQEVDAIYDYLDARDGLLGAKGPPAKGS